MPGKRGSKMAPSCPQLRSHHHSAPGDIMTTLLFLHFFLKVDEEGGPGGSSENWGSQVRPSCPSESLLRPSENPNFQTGSDYFRPREYLKRPLKAADSFSGPQNTSRQQVRGEATPSGGGTPGGVTSGATTLEHHCTLVHT